MSGRERKVAVVIPAHNEESVIGPVVGAASRIWSRVFVVDDGSTDKTGLYAKEAGGDVLRHAARCGYGAALRSGIEEALRSGFEIVITLDGDGSHDPGESERLVEEHVRRRADLTIGSRCLDGHSEWFPSSKRAANRLASAILNAALGTRLQDVLSGYRVIDANLVKGVGLSCGFGASVDLIAHAAEAGLCLHEAEAQVRYDARELHCTTCNEICHFLESCLRFAKQPLQGQIRRLRGLIGVEARIWAVLREACYVLHKIDGADGYLVQTQHPWFPPPSETDSKVELTA